MEGEWAELRQDGSALWEITQYNNGMNCLVANMCGGGDDVVR